MTCGLWDSSGLIGPSSRGCACWCRMCVCVCVCVCECVSACVMACVCSREPVCVGLCSHGVNTGHNTCYGDCLMLRHVASPHNLSCASQSTASGSRRGATWSKRSRRRALSTRPRCERHVRRGLDLPLPLCHSRHRLERWIRVWLPLDQSPGLGKPGLRPPVAKRVAHAVQVCPCSWRRRWWRWQR